MAYSVSFTASAAKDVSSLDGTIRERILRALNRLALDPHASPNVKATKGGGYRLRMGDYRVLYELYDDRLIVLVLRIGHRREVYR